LAQANFCTVHNGACAATLRGNLTMTYRWQGSPVTLACSPLMLAVVVAQLQTAGSQAAFGASGQPHLGNCPPNDEMWQGLLTEVNRGAGLFKSGNFPEAKKVLANAAEVVTRDEQRAFQCSLGLSAMYRALAFAYCTSPQLEGRAMRRANQIGLRFLHLAMNWLTHTFVTTNHDMTLIDTSAWPIAIQDINEDLTAVANSIKSTGPIGNGPTLAGATVPHDYRRPDLRIAIVSLCAYPPEHVLPKFSASNQGLYAERHGYTLLMEREMVDSTRPPAWGKVKLMQKALSSEKWDWVVWADCDTYFMNMSITLESVLFTYAAQKANATESPDADLVLSPDMHMIVSEDSAMLNTGIFFVRSSDYVTGLLDRVWGSDSSPWINHPWWENAAFGWEFLKGLPQRFAMEDQAEWAQTGEDDMLGVYPPQVRVAPQSHFNSYHPVTSRFLHDTWEEGKFVIAFNGVLSASSPAVVSVLYGTYYHTACRLNNIESQCLPERGLMPWDQD